MQGTFGVNLVRKISFLIVENYEVISIEQRKFQIVTILLNTNDEMYLNCDVCRLVCEK